MELEVTLQSVEELPDPIKELYTKQGEEYRLTGVKGLKTQADVDKVLGDLNKEREAHKETKSKYRPWAEMDHNEVTQKLDRFNELEIAAKGNKEEMDSKLEELTEARIGSRLAPIERQNKELAERFQAQEEELLGLRKEKLTRTIHDAIRGELANAKVIPEAEADVLMLADAVFHVEEGTNNVVTKENPYGIPAGLSPDIFLTQMKDKRPHWWPATHGGGATGSRENAGAFGANPWSAKHWNMTKQGQYVIQYGEEKAKQMAETAGTSLGGKRPELAK